MIKKEFFSWRKIEVKIQCIILTSNFLCILSYAILYSKMIFKHCCIFCIQEKENFIDIKFFYDDKDSVFIEYWYMLTWIVLIRDFWSKFTIVKYNIQFLEIYRFIIQRRNKTLYQHFNQNYLVLVMNFIILKHQVITNVLQMIKRLKNA